MYIQFCKFYYTYKIVSIIPMKSQPYNIEIKLMRTTAGETFSLNSSLSYAIQVSSPIMSTENANAKN